MSSDWVAKYTHTQHDSMLILKTVVSPYCFNVTYEAAMCTHEQDILVHHNVVHTPATCNDSVF